MQFRPVSGACSLAGGPPTARNDHSLSETAAAGLPCRNRRVRPKAVVIRLFGLSRRIRPIAVLQSSSALSKRKCQVLLRATDESCDLEASIVRPKHAKHLRAVPYLKAENPPLHAVPPRAGSPARMLPRAAGRRRASSDDRARAFRSKVTSLTRSRWTSSPPPCRTSRRRWSRIASAWSSLDATSFRPM